VPEAPDAIVTKLPLLVAVHAHVDPAVTPADPVPPSGPNVEVGCATVKEQFVVGVGVVGVESLLPHAAAARAAASVTFATRSQRSRSVIGTSSVYRKDVCGHYCWRRTLVNHGA
jgi:hypothetical protein